jgi:Cu+-exporting ATPase
MWRLESEGKTAVCVAVNGCLIGLIAAADAVKPEAAQAVAALRQMGIDVWMVTGDTRTTAEAVAEEVGLPRDRVVAGALPVDKVTEVRRLQQGGKVRVAMVGDGVNDSPALVQADLGVAIGAGTHVAIAAADMVLVRSSLLDVPVALDLARVVFRRIQLNFIWAAAYNAVAVPFAAGAFFPLTHTLVSPQYAGLMMALSSISVVLSSLALRLYTRPASVSEAAGTSMSLSMHQPAKSMEIHTTLHPSRKLRDGFLTRAIQFTHQSASNAMTSLSQAVVSTSGSPGGEYSLVPGVPEEEESYAVVRTDDGNTLMHKL